MTAVAEHTANWVEAFSKQPVSGFQELRGGAFQRFLELGFPTTREEEWRFTNVASIARQTFQVKDGAPVVSGLSKGANLGTADDARAHLGRYAAFDRNAFVALNTAFLNNVAVIRIDRGAIVEEPIYLNYTNSGQSSTHPRALILVGAGAQCTIVETYEGGGEYFTNAVTEIAAGDGAVVDHYKVTRESSSAFHVATLQASLGRSTNFSTHSFSLGGALVRNDAGAVLSEGTEATLNGLFLVNGTQHVDNHTVIDHAKPNANSHELYKGILDGRANAVFNGRIIVRKDAQKTDSKQTNKNLVLSESAVINTKPELQILADDVRCTHGATIGQIDAESMFYLQSRGIGRKEARSILTYAFAKDVVDRVMIASLRDSLERILVEKFNEHSD